jgi:hypothetical protein
VHFCIIGAPSEARVQKGTVWVRNCNIAGRVAEMVHKCTTTSPTQRS